MGVFTDLLINGFSKQDELLYSPGTLYEITSKLGDNDNAMTKTDKVKNIIGNWVSSPEMMIGAGADPVAFALELHAANDENTPQHGYGTYMFVPDAYEDTAMNTIATTYTVPREIADDEDPLKALASRYADDRGFSTENEMTILEMGPYREEYYPIKVWGSGGGMRRADTSTMDPLENIFSVFDGLKHGEFAGISIVMSAAGDAWRTAGANHIRALVDPSFVEHLSLGKQIMHKINGTPIPEHGNVRRFESVFGLGASVDPNAKRASMANISDEDKAEIQVIQSKMNRELFAFNATLRVYGSSRAIAAHIADLISQSSISNQSGQLLVVKNEYGNLRSMALRQMSENSFVMNSAEIATLWHVPDESLYGEKRGAGRMCHRPQSAATVPPDDLIIIPKGGPADLQALFQKLNSGGV